MRATRVLRQPKEEAMVLSSTWRVGGKEEGETEASEGSSKMFQEV
jgi:hypothetical protein